MFEKLYVNVSKYSKQEGQMLKNTKKCSKSFLGDGLYFMTRYCPEASIVYMQ